MKKLCKLFVLTATLILCAATLTFNASAFPILIGIPSTVSEGSVWLIVGIAVIVIAVAAILIVKKAKASKGKKEDNKD